MHSLARFVGCTFSREATTAEVVRVSRTRWRRALLG